VQAASDSVQSVVLAVASTYSKMSGVVSGGL
jgi:hypothetical protein